MKCGNCGARSHNTNACPKKASTAPTQSTAPQKSAEEIFAELNNHGRKEHGKRSNVLTKIKQRQAEKSVKQIEERLKKRDDDKDNGGASGTPSLTVATNG